MSNCFTVGYFARVAPEKGLHVLADAYVQAAAGDRLRRQRPGSRRISGAGAPRSICMASSARMKEAGLDHEFRYRGVLDRPHKIDFLRNLDVL